MDLQLLTEPHSFSAGDKVIVQNRYNANEIYPGTVYKIIRLPLNKGIKTVQPDIDYFYITFSDEVYEIFLKRGWEIIYKHECKVTGHGVFRKNNILKTILQNPSSGSETEIDVKDINAILIWRIAFDIKKA